ncbi:MAG: anthranilate synthase component I [Pseudomonadota bacterium]|jgi:anthranilate synthase component 1
MTTAEPGLDAFAKTYGEGRAQLVWMRVVDDLETPVSAYLKIGHGRPYAFLYESVEGGAWRGRYSIIALEPDLVWRSFGGRAERAEGTDIASGRFTPEAKPTLESLRDLVAECRFDLPPGLPPMAAGLFGVLGYDMIRLAEPLGEPNPDPLNLPDAVMTRPSVVAIFDGVAQEIILATPARPGAASAEAAHAEAVARLEALRQKLAEASPARPAGTTPKPCAPLTSPVSQAAYGEIVEKAKQYIRAGDIFQVVPSHRFSADYPRDPFAFYRSLRRTNPSPFLYFLNFGDFQLAGSSPEILVRLRDRKITIRPIAGTRRRGATPEEDQALETELLADPKERAEHLMLLDLGRNDVGRAVLSGDEGRNAETTAPRVRVTQSFFIERYSHVMHIVSNVEGDAAPDADPVDVILAALPAGTLSGAPKVRAMQIIDELEMYKRGVGYGGAAGYISANGSVDTCIVLRTALFKDGRIYAQAGGGVVADSDPKAEYEETLHKLGAIRRAADEAWRFE